MFNEPGTSICTQFVLLGGESTFDAFMMDDVQQSYQYSYNEVFGHVTFNTTVYSNTAITSKGTGPNGLHNLTITSLFPMAFDYAVYTCDILMFS